MTYNQFFTYTKHFAIADLWLSYYNPFTAKSATELKNENKFGCLLAEIVLILSRLLFFPPNYVSTLNNKCKEIWFHHLFPSITTFLLPFINRLYAQNLMI